MDTIDRYFALATGADTDAFFDQFTRDATVEDDGNLYRGIDEIRRWRTEVPLVTYTVVGRDGADVETEISGDFPGSPVTLRYRFEFTADERIAVLRIRP